MEQAGCGESFNIPYKKQQTHTKLDTTVFLMMFHQRISTIGKVHTLTKFTLDQPKTIF